MKANPHVTSPGGSTRRPVSIAPCEVETRPARRFPPVRPTPLARPAV